MGLLDNVIKRGIRQGVSQAVAQAIAPKINEAVDRGANALAGQISEAAGGAPQQQYAPTYQTQPTQSAAMQNLAGSLSGLNSALTSFADEAAKNMVVCPSCGEAAKLGGKFCPSCGGPLPQRSIAEEAVCESCGTQNDAGAKFCSGCGAKLAGTLREEKNLADKSAGILAGWPTELAAFPVYCGDGYVTELERGTNGDEGWYYNIYIQQASKQGFERYAAALAQGGYRRLGDIDFVRESDGWRCTVYGDDAWNGSSLWFGYSVVRVTEQPPQQKKGLFNIFG